MSHKTRVAVGMSGGVDSTIAAYLLKKAGYDVTGLTMKIWDDPGTTTGKTGACYSPDRENDLNNIRDICCKLNIPHYTIPLASEFRHHVIEYFRNEYLSGRTPNPCMVCNREIKFALLLARAREMDLEFNYFATGHYAIVEHDKKSGRFLLKRGLDREKDQSYFLALLRQEQLEQTMFPLGAMTKPEVKALAKKLGFKTLAEHRESQDFVENGSYQVLFQDTDARTGPIIDSTGKILGEHSGIMNYTIGQRKKLGLNGNPDPLYVTAINAEENTITVGPESDLMARGLIACDLNWIAFDNLVRERSVNAKIRRQHPETGALISPARCSEEPCTRVKFAQSQMSVTPGQAVVFYDGDLVLGGGTILRAEK